MTGGEPRNQPAVRARREGVIRQLSEHFAQDVLTLEEFEDRLDQAHRAETLDSLDALLGDLPASGAVIRPGSSPSPAPDAGGTRSLSAEVVPSHRLAVGFWGGSVRKGSWIPGRRNTALAIMGGVELDLREAGLAEGVTHITVFALWGGVHIIVPPGLQVEFAGHGIMGGFDCDPAVAPVLDPGRPIVRITGVAVMGGAEVEVRQPGESGGDARHRRREERRRRRAAARRGGTR